MQTEKSQSEGKRIMPEIPALSVDPRIGISRSASEKTLLPALSVSPRVRISRSASETDV